VARGASALRTLPAARLAENGARLLFLLTGFTIRPRYCSDRLMECGPSAPHQAADARS
jgi:hypothetical protein